MDKPARLGSRAMEVLRVLMARQGEVVTKDQLLEAAWPGLVVEENNISVQIAALRKVIGHDAIATIAKQGYRLVVTPDTSPALAGLLSSGDREVEAGSPLIGRDDDIELLATRINQSALVTIVGTGGVGKTSLAKLLAARHAAHDNGAVHWIDLSPVRDGSRFTHLVAEALGIALDRFSLSTDDLIATLGRSTALIVVDNCEHLVGDVAVFIRRCMERAPGLRWLATSQEPMHIPNEVIHRLGPLEVPAADADLAAARTCGALALLHERAAAADHHFVLDDDNIAIAIDLCRQLDGLPLAIEMAAARVATLGLEAVHLQLGQRLHLLTGPRGAPPRHHTLLGTFDWSYELLDPDERKVFRRLEPFLGGFSLVLAEEVASDADTVASSDRAGWELTALSALIDKSLVHRRADAPGRFYLFDSARDYARRRLLEAGEADSVRQRHANAIADWFDTARDDAERLNDERWMARYGPERHNVRAALAWACAAGPPDLVARLVAALARIDLIVRGPAEVMQLVIPIDTLRAAAPPHRAAACLELSWTHFLEGNRKTGSELATIALEDFRSLGDQAGAYQALAQLIRLYESRPGMLPQANDAWVLLQKIDDRAFPLRTRLFCAITAGLQYGSDRSLGRLEELQDLASRAGLDSLAAICRTYITDWLLIERRFDEAARTAQRFLDRGEAKPRVIGILCINQVLALVQLGRTEEAFGPARVAMHVLPSAVHYVFATLALGAARAGRFVDAGLLAGYSDRVKRERDEAPDPAEREANVETKRLLAHALGDERMAELLQVGATMSTSELAVIAMPTTTTR